MTTNDENINLWLWVDKTIKFQVETSLASFLIVRSLDHQLKLLSLPSYIYCGERPRNIVESIKYFEISIMEGTLTMDTDRRCLVMEYCSTDGKMVGSFRAIVSKDGGEIPRNVADLVIFENKELKRKRKTLFVVLNYNLCAMAGTSCMFMFPGFEGN